MIEKTSESICCTICGKPATVLIAGIPYCNICAESDDAKEASELVELFGD